MARQKFLNKNFPSMNMSDDEKEKINKKIKEISGAAVSEKELQFLKDSVPNSVKTVAEFKKLLEEQMK